MEAVFILLLLLTLVTFILTRKTRVNIIKDEGWRVEIHFTLAALHFQKLAAGDKKKKRKKQKKKNPPAYYFRIFRRVSELLEVGEVELRCLTLSMAEGDFERTDYTRPYRYHSLISSLLAYLEGKSKRLTVRDNAITLVPDGKDTLHLNISIEVTLFYLLRTVLRLLHDKKETRGRQRAEYVGN